MVTINLLQKYLKRNKFKTKTNHDIKRLCIITAKLGDCNEHTAHSS